MLKVLLCATLALPLGAASAPAARSTYRPEYSKPTLGAQSCMSGDVLYSQRAKRRAAILMRMQLLELHRAELERVKAAVEGTLPLGQLLAAPAK